MKRKTKWPTRGRIRWRHGGDCRSDLARRQEEENETFCARSFLLDDALFWNFKRVSNAGSPFVSRFEKKMKDELGDEIKLAGLESLVPEELEKHLILNSNRLRTFEDARLEVVTFVEAKFGSDTGVRGDSDPMDVRCGQLSLVWQRKRVIESSRWVIQVRWSTFSTRLQCTQEHSQAIAWKRQTEQVMVQE